MDPLVSIIIPVYNSENYISETIKSILGQTFKTWELIIINDGSTDRSAPIIEEFICDPRIILVNTLNKGVSSARNLGISEARGEYLAFIDADDVWLPENLEKKVSALQSGFIDFVFSDMYEADENLANMRLAPIGKDHNLLENLLLWKGEVIPAPPSNLVIKRECFETKLSFDSRFSTAADLDFTIYLALNYSGRRLPEPLFIYRIRGDSMSRDVALMEKDVLGVFMKAQKLNLLTVKSFRRRCFSNVYYMIGASWWVNGKRRFRGAVFIIRALFIYPPLMFKLLKKFNRIR